VPVVVVGSLNVDALTRVAAIPRPGETVLAQSLELRHGGKGGNQASAAARLGARTIMVGCVGDDDAGVDALAALRADGVDVSGVLVGQGPTGTATVLVAADGENVIVVNPGANRALTADHVRAVLAEYPKAVVLVSLEVPIDTAITAAEAAAQGGGTVVVNAAPARQLPARLLAACDVLVANELEVTQLGSDIAELLASGPVAVVVTSGRRGADIHYAGGAVHHQPAFAIDAVDSTGAGDAFCGGLAWSLANGDDLARAVLAASATGALATRAVGPRASLPAAADVSELLTNHAGGGR
jgi:ribokinase